MVCFFFAVLLIKDINCRSRPQKWEREAVVSVVDIQEYTRGLLEYAKVYKKDYKSMQSVY